MNEFEIVKANGTTFLFRVNDYSIINSQNEEIVIDMKYKYYKPCYDNQRLLLNFAYGKNYKHFSMQNVSIFGYDNDACRYIDINRDNALNYLNDELFEYFKALNDIKEDLFKQYNINLRESVNKLFSDKMRAIISNLIYILDKNVILDIEAYFSLKNFLFLQVDQIVDSYLKAHYNTYYLENTKKDLIRIENKFFYNVTNYNLRYPKLSDFIELYNNKDGIFYENDKNRDKNKNRLFRQHKSFIDLIKKSASSFDDFVKIMQSHYQFSKADPRDTLWVVFNHYLMELYHNKWLEYCVCGEIGKRTLEEYIQICCDEDMLSLENREAITVFIYYYCYLLNNPIDYPNIEIADKIITLVENSSKENSLKVMENMLFASPKVSANQIFYTIDDIDLMDGVEFEKLIAKLFRKMGYDAEVTKTSGDQGIDVIATKNGFKYGIQAKCYSSQVSNSAIQEAVAGKAFYSLNKVIVVTNKYFTKSAIQLAEANSVVLWDRTILKEKLMYLNG